MQQEEIIILLTKTSNIQTTLLLLILFGSLSLFTVEADIFKCTNLNGGIYYNDKPCPKNNKQQKMKAQKDIVNGYVPKDSTKKKNIQNEDKDYKFTNEEIINNDQSSKQKDTRSNHKGSNQSVSNSFKKNLKTIQKTTTQFGEVNQNPIRHAPVTEEEKEALFVEMHVGEGLDNSE